ncbi:FBN3 [Branchiostoma lanceolatum]|uniref:FBN3 protein n=1 Tax=Branchiostoma lanceolatum TaxID=7740 RepID=A0A8J9YYG2_BRALA|nr:FBN3 [Branchiostoma lanceolatum]
MNVMMTAVQASTEPRGPFLTIQGPERERHITFTYFDRPKNSPIKTLKDRTYRQNSFVAGNKDGRTASSNDLKTAKNRRSSPEQFMEDRRANSAGSLSQDVVTVKVSPSTHVVRPLTRHSHDGRLQDVFFEDTDEPKVHEDTARVLTTGSVVPGAVDDGTSQTPVSRAGQPAFTAQDETSTRGEVASLTDKFRKSAAVVPVKVSTGEEKAVTITDDVVEENGKPQDAGKEKRYTDRQLYLSVIRHKRRLFRDTQNLARTQNVTSRNFCILLTVLALLIVVVITYIIVNVATESVAMATPRPPACVSNPCRNAGVCVGSADGETYTCICAEGFWGQDCLRDVDECGTDSARVCDVRAVCTNVPGSFQCACAQGFTGDGFSCTDLDECTEDAAACSDVTNADCVNTEGSFQCACQDGYQDSGGQCTDIDECAVQSGGCDVDRGQCVNTDGGRTCQCLDGYQGDGTVNNCFDIDECAEDAAACPDDNAACVNTAGSFRCDCREGYQDSGGLCADVDECAVQSGGCDPNRGRCVNTPGSRTCQCRNGFQGDGTANNCFDIDECAANANACPDPNSDCENTEGSFRCECKDGYTDGPAGFCIEIDECDSGPCANGGSCVNLLSRYLCLCDVGWTGDTCQLPTLDNPIFG